MLVAGEPLCYPGLFELGRAITELEFRWGMVTNGYAWPERAVSRGRDRPDVISEDRGAAIERNLNQSLKSAQFDTFPAGRDGF